MTQVVARAATDQQAAPEPCGAAEPAERLSVQCAVLHARLPAFHDRRVWAASLNQTQPTTASASGSVNDPWTEPRGSRRAPPRAASRPALRRTSVPSRPGSTPRGGRVVRVDVGAPHRREGIRGYGAELCRERELRSGRGKRLRATRRRQWSCHGLACTWSSSSRRRRASSGQSSRGS